MEGLGNRPTVIDYAMPILVMHQAYIKDVLTRKGTLECEVFDFALPNYNLLLGGVIMRRQIGLLGILFALVAGVALWWLPQVLPPSSPFDQALKALAQAIDAKSKMTALNNLRQTLQETTLTAEEKNRLIAQLAETAERDADASVRATALTLLWSLGERKEVMLRLLLSALRRSSQEAQMALQWLPSTADAATWRRLMDAYESERDPVIRDRLLRLLRQTPPTQWRELCRRLGHNPSTWEAVAIKLTISDPSARDDLVTWALSSDTALQKGALLLLNKFAPSPEASAKLAPLARHSDEMVRRLVMAIWSQAPSPKVVPELRAALRDKPTIAALASSALLKLGALKPEEGRKLLQSRYAPLRAQGALALAASQDEKDWQLLTQKLHDPDPEVIRNAAVALAAKGEKGLNEVLRTYRAELKSERRAALLTGICGINHPKVIAILVRALRFGDWREQGVALTGLALHRDNAVSALERVFNGTAEQQEKLAAIYALNAIGTSKAMRLLLRVAQNDKDKRIRCEALLALSNRQAEEAFPLLKRFLQEGDAAFANDMALALTRYGEKGRKVLRELLHANKEAIRQAAAKALASIGDKAALSVLQQQAASADPSQRMATLQALARAGDEKALQELITFLGSSEALVRIRARLALYAIGHVAVPALMKALDDDNPSMRAEAAMVLGALRAETAREKLAALLNDPDPQVRQAAQQALTRLE